MIGNSPRRLLILERLLICLLKISIVVPIHTIEGSVPSQPGPIPVDRLFQDNDYMNLKISPDGKYLAGTTLKVDELSGRRTYMVDLWRYEVATGEVVSLVAAPWAWVQQFHWVDNDRILCEMIAEDKYYWKAFDVDGSDEVELIPVPRKLENLSKFVNSFETVKFIDPLVQEKDWILFEGDWKSRHLRKGAPGSLLPDGLYRWNTRTLEYAKIITAPSLTERWVLSRNGEPVVHVGYSSRLLELYEELAEKEYMELEFSEFREIHRLNSDGDWERLKDIDPTDRHFRVCSLLEDQSGFLFVDDQGKDKRGVYRYLFAKGIDPEPVVYDDKCDVLAVSTDIETHTTYCVFTEYLKPEATLLDPELSQLFKQLTPVFKDGLVTFGDWDQSMTQVVIKVIRQDNPGEFFLLNRSTRTLVPILKINPWLWEYDHGRKIPVEITARDGLIMPAYLTLPPGRDEGTGPMPLIVKVRGGPWFTKDSFTFDLENQFYATRGFAVLQVNFRGSTGFGKSFENLGNGEFGRGMYTDIIDSVKWAIERKLTRPGMIGIAGGGFGGTLAIQALAWNPELFEFGISINGYPDLPESLEFWKDKKYFRLLKRAGEWLGDPDDPEIRKTLHAVSPVNLTATMEDPLFLYYGMRDALIPFTSQKAFYKKLKEQDKEFIRIYDRYEGHNPFLDFEKRIELFQQIEAFLDVRKKEFQPENN